MQTSRYYRFYGNDVSFIYLLKSSILMQYLLKGLSVEQFPTVGKRKKYAQITTAQTTTAHMFDSY